MQHTTAEKTAEGRKLAKAQLQVVWFVSQRAKDKASDCGWKGRKSGDQPEKRKEEGGHVYEREHFRNLVLVILSICEINKLNVYLHVLLHLPTFV